jgi:antagonist of KipI
MTTVQDSGRWGHQREGVSVSGAMDRVAHRVANALVGNESFAATMEVTMIGPEVACLRDTIIAVTGADLSPQVDGRPVPRHQAVLLPAGAVVSFGERRQGARAYVAFAGGVDVPVVLGSRATHAPSAIGGVSGRPLRAGDELAILPRGPLPSRRPASPAAPAVKGGARVRVLAGPQAERFPPEALARLTGSRFALSAESSRMGYRLQGSTVPAPVGEMISDVTFPGAVQVPPSGDPILLMADRQTTGGYAQLAIVISADLPVAAQLAPGDWIEFELTTLSSAVAALADQERTLHHFERHAFA